MYRSVTRIAAFSMIAAILGASAPSYSEPPPIPTRAEREQLVASEMEAYARTKQVFAPRAVHDEYDVAHYDVTMSLDIADRVVFGTTLVTAVAEVTDLSEIGIDLYPCLTADEVFANGSPASFSHDDEILTIVLGETFQPGDTFTVAASYHGTPAFPGNPVPFYFANHAQGPMILSYSEPYGAPAWWMCKDDPKDKATLSLHLTVPDSLVAVSNGLLDSVVVNSDTTEVYHWSTNYPMSPYLFSVAVTNYETWTDVYTALDGKTTMDVDYYAYPQDLTKAQVSWSRNVEMMEYYRTLFGEYPFLEEKYAIAEFQHSGAMEHQTATSYSRQFVTGNNQYDFVVAHELSHSWVGDMITMTTWAHAWCKEGFATICEAFWFESLYGEAYYHAYMNGMDVLSYAPYQIFDIDPPLSNVIYYKGAWVLHMLRHVLGDTDFFDGVYAYANEPGFLYGVADTEELRGVFESVSGMDLVWFFDQWIYSPGYPVYQFGWTSIPVASGYDVELEITQTQDVGPIFKMPIDIDVETDLGTERFVVLDSLETQAFVLHVEGTPLDVALDPDNWIIKETETAGVGEAPQMAGLVLSQNRPNPFSPRTGITYELGAPGPVRLAIYDVTGRRVKTLLQGPQPAGLGRVVWDGRDADGQPVTAGVYFYSLEAGGESRSRRMVLVR